MRDKQVDSDAVTIPNTSQPPRTCARVHLHWSPTSSTCTDIISTITASDSVVLNEHVMSSWQFVM